MLPIEILHNRIDLADIPLTERGSRLLLFRRGDELAIRLAERWVKWEKEVGPYRRRPPMIEHFTFTDAAGAPQNLASTDTYPHVARLSTGLGMFEVGFVDVETFFFRLPAGRYGFTFQAHADQAVNDRRGGTLHGKRNIAYTTNATLLKNEAVEIEAGLHQITLQVEADDGDCLLLNITPRLAYNRAIPDNLNDHIEASRRSWQAWLDAAPPVADPYKKQYAYAWWLMRSGLFNTRYYFTREALVPSKVHYVGVWLWDQFFHALAYRHVDTRLAEDQLRITLDHQQANGMLPDAIHDEGLVTHLYAPVDADVTKPPLNAWAAWKCYEKSKRIDFIDEIYQPLLKWHEWWYRDNTDPETGLCLYQHPFSSGLDDNPLWDGGMPVVAPDLNTYIVLSELAMANMARELNMPENAAEHQARAEDFSDRMYRYMWDEKRGYFPARRNGEPIEVYTPFSLLPIVPGLMPEHVNNRVIELLTDPNTFWTQYPLPSVALNDPSYDHHQMWRGPTWINVNYLFIEGLNRLNRKDVAAELRRRTLTLIQRHKDIYEYYDPVTGDPPPKAAPMFGWTTALFIDLVIEESQQETPSSE